MITYSEIEDAFLFVNASYYGDHTAILLKNSGRILYQSESGDVHEISEEEVWDADDAIEIPHQNDLRLGKEIVFNFVSDNLPDDYEYVQQIFSNRGAYTRYKELLHSKGLLKAWYDYENAAQEKALRKWCQLYEIEISD